MKRLLLALLLLIAGVAEGQAPSNGIRGFPNGSRETRTPWNQATIVDSLSDRHSVDVACHAASQLIASDAVEAGSTTSVINATGHSALAGDVILFTSGVLIGQEFSVDSKSANAITLGQTASTAPSAADTFDILRYNPLRVDSSGGLRVGTVSGAVTSRIVGNAGATLDSTIGPGTAPSNMVVGGAIYRATPFSLTDGQSAALQSTFDGTLKVVIGDGQGLSRFADVDSLRRLSVVPTFLNGSIPAHSASIADNEDAASGDGDRAVKIHFKRQDTPANASDTDGDYEQPQMSAGRVWTSATIDTALPAGTNNIGDVDVASIAAGDNNIGNVDLASAIPAGTNAIGKLAANSGVDIGDVTIDNAAGTNPVPVQGNVAHDSAVSGNPVLMGGEARSTNPTAVGSGDTVRAQFTTEGKQVTHQCAIPNVFSSQETSHVSDTAAKTLRAAQGSGIRNCIYSIDASNEHASTGSRMTISDGARSFTFWMPPNSHVFMNYGCSLCFAADTAVTATGNTSVDRLRIAAQMYTAVY